MAYDKSLIKTALKNYENPNQKKYTVSFEISNRDVYLDDLEHLLKLSVDFKKLYGHSLGSSKLVKIHRSKVSCDRNL